MTNIKSAAKRVQIAERNRLRNKSYKSAIKTLSKRYISALEGYESSEKDEQALEDVNQKLSAAYSKIDKAVKRGVIHRNSAARKKARLAKAFKKYFPSPQAETAQAS
ncbi:MAG: 30S ribosomal protein S20 [Microcoleaceae cyanobacterium]